MSRKKSREYAFRLVFENFFHEPEQELELVDEDFVINDEDKIVKYVFKMITKK